jgi:hypothetical protein
MHPYIRTTARSLLQATSQLHLHLPATFSVTAHRWSPHDNRTQPIHSYVSQHRSIHNRMWPSCYRSWTTASMRAAWLRIEPGSKPALSTPTSHLFAPSILHLVRFVSAPHYTVLAPDYCFLASTPCLPLHSVRCYPTAYNLRCLHAALPVYLLQRTATANSASSDLVPSVPSCLLCCAGSFLPLRKPPAPASQLHR